MSTVKTILLVEDDLKDIELTIEALDNGSLSNQIIVARDGVEAMDYLRCQGKYELREKVNPDLVLLDIKMPRMDGTEVLRTIREDDALKRIPIVILSSSREQGDLVNSYDLGVNAYVVKPVNFKQFIEAVKQIDSFWAVLNEFPSERSV